MKTRQQTSHVRIATLSGFPTAPDAGQMLQGLERYSYSLQCSFAVALVMLCM